MRLPCLLRHARGERTLKQVADGTGIKSLGVADLSRIERGIQLPRDAWKDALARVYGLPPHEWYPPEVLLVVERDEDGEP